MTKAAKLTGLLLAALMAVVTLGACSGSGGGSAASSDYKAAARADIRGAAPAAPSAANLPRASGANTDAAGSSGGTKAAANALDDATAKIRTAWMTVDVRGAANVAAKADSADDIVQSVGGEIDSDDRTSGKHATATLRLRVPPNSLQPVLNQLGELGVEKSRQSSTTDVTEQVADVASRVRSAQSAITQLRTLYRHAGKVGDLLAVEDELATREANLEALEAQQRSLARQTGLATVTLSLRTAVVHHPVTRHPAPRTGFVGGLQRGWDGFVATAVWIASAFATLLPFLALLVLVALGLRVFGVRIPRPHRTT